jgi:RimJ/RimL family protein N-acetyltransferase
MLKIRPHSEKDIPLRVKWQNNPKVDRFISDEPGRKFSLKDIQTWFQNYRKNRNKKFFTICVDGIPIGWMGISHISKPNRNADLFLAIGEDAYRGKGYGKQALTWLVDYALKKLKLHKVKADVYETNRPSLGLCQSLGFKKEGHLKDEAKVGGKWVGQIALALFAQNWK